MNKINPRDYLDTPLWCVYGSPAFPSIICCMVTRSGSHGPIIWGYSTYKNQPAFRTLGTTITEFEERRERCLYFAEQQHALDYLKELTTPKIK